MINQLIITSIKYNECKLKKVKTWFTFIIHENKKEELKSSHDRWTWILVLSIYLVWVNIIIIYFFELYNVYHTRKNHLIKVDIKNVNIMVGVKR